ncbi:MAG: FKBP-type peptidyl-prolyl cis-trans isomerase [Gemmatimonadota bacterium]
MRPSVPCVARSPRFAKRVASFLAMALPAATLPGCVDSTGPPHPLLEETDFAPALGVDLDQMTRIGGGVYVQDLTVGTGPVLEVGHRVEIAYDLFVPEGRHVLRRESTRFVRGCRQVVPGLETGILDMRVDGTRRIVVPPRLGFGEQPPWLVDVPPYSILVYVVEALDSTPVPHCEAL